jgi:hypothetical protein
MIAAYVGFILLVAFDKQLAGRPLAGGRISLGIVLGAGLIVLAAALTGVYVRWANRVYDVERARLRGERAAAATWRRRCSPASSAAPASSASSRRSRSRRSSRWSRG